MPFERKWDASCPQEYDRWQSDGVTFVIQDLPPEDDEEALKLLVEHLIPDETLCAISDLQNDPTSLRSMSDFWRICLKKRMSIACYAEEREKRTLAALNCCIVDSASEKEEYSEFEGEAWINVYNVLKYMEEKLDSHKYLGLDQLLYAMGLVVKREFRGNGLGAKVLAAREPLCLSQGLEATSTVFTGPAAQKSASKAGLETVFETTLRELAETGLKYPKDDRVIKLMVKKYVK